MQLGTATVDITPSAPIDLAGFAARTGPYEKVRAPLSLQVFAFGGDVVLVCADLLWWGPDVVAEIRRRVAEEYRISPERLVLHASHTHCAPMPGLTCSPLLGAGDPAYVARLVDTTVAAIGRALESSEEVDLCWGRSEAAIGVNRRRKNPDGTVGGPDPEGEVDHEVVVLSFRRPDGSTKAVMVHYTCHPVISDARLVGPDYPGAMREHVADEVGADVTIGFLQGCCGDVNPALIRDEEFYRGGDEEIDRLGGRLADAVLEVLGAPMAPLSVPVVMARTGEVSLPLQVPSRHELARRRHEPAIIGDWASWLLADPSRLVDRIPLTLSVLQLGGVLTLLGFDAEVTVPYGLWIKRRFSGRVLPLGYTNGMIGYVPTAEQLADGGYEPDESYQYIYRPGRFAPDVEQLVKRAIDDAVHR
ncbi:MAG TPA: hypothetical protein VI076_12560 [Actinopolymorphaceae bacterium]